MMMKQTVLVLMIAALARCQRPSFAGSRPIGYPEITTVSTTPGLGDRFGEADATTQRLPVEANGDRDLVDRLSKLPIDQQPFWLINWQALEAHRQKPQTFPQKPNPFVDPPQNPGQANTNLGSANSFILGGQTSSGNVASFSANLQPANTNAGSFGSLGSSNSANRGGNTGSLVNRGNAGILNSASAFTVPISNSNNPDLANRFSDVSSTSNSANVGLEDRFSGGIEPNRFEYYESLKLSEKH